MEFIKQNLSLYLLESGLLLLVLLVTIILQVIISKQQFFRPYRLVGLMANMVASLVMSIWVSSVSLTFYEELVKTEGYLTFYINRILPFLLGAWVIYFTAIICTHFLTIAIEEHKIYKKSEKGKELDNLKSEFITKTDWK